MQCAYICSLDLSTMCMSDLQLLILLMRGTAGPNSETTSQLSMLISDLSQMCKVFGFRYLSQAFSVFGDGLFSLLAYRHCPVQRHGMAGGNLHGHQGSMYIHCSADGCHSMRSLALIGILSPLRIRKNLWERRDSPTGVVPEGSECRALSHVEARELNC